MKAKQGYLTALTALIRNTVTSLSKMLIVVSLLLRSVSSNLLWLFGFALPQATYLHNEHLELKQCIVKPSAQRWGWDAFLKSVLKSFFSGIHSFSKKTVCLRDICETTKWNSLNSTKLLEPRVLVDTSNEQLPVFFFFSVRSPPRYNQMLLHQLPKTFQKQERGSWPFMTPSALFLLCYCWILVFLSCFIIENYASLWCSIPSMWHS